MTKLERCKLLSTYNDGITVNGTLKLDLDTSFRHMLLIGSTGSGKSTIVYLNMILTQNLPMIILDLSGSLYDQTSGHLRRQGYRILRLNFSDPTHSEGYNPMMRADTDSKLKRLATTIVGTALKGAKDPFWGNSAGMVLYSLMRCLKEAAPVEQQNLGNLRHLLNNLTFEPDCPTMLWAMKNVSDETLDEFTASVSGNEKVVGSILSTARTALEKLSDPGLSQMAATDSLGDLQSIRRRKTALYLTVKETEVQYLSFLLSLVLGDLFDMAMEMPGKRDRPLLFLLDEFAHMHIEGFSSVLTTLRKRNVSCVISIQSRSMLSHQYGAADAETIMNGGVGSTLVLPGQNNPRENRELSQMLGDHLVQYKDREVVRPLLTPDEIYSLKGTGVFMHAGHRPALLKLFPFYKNKKLLALTKIRPVSYQKKKLPSLSLIDLSPYKDMQDGMSLDV